MRWLLLLVTLAVVGCGSAHRATLQRPVPREPQTRPKTCRYEDSCFKRSASLWNCSHLSRGFRACSAFRDSGDQTGIYWRVGRTWRRFAGPARRHGWWIRVIGAPNKRVALAQWSGECETQTTYIVDRGRARPIFARSESYAVGWSTDGRARVRVPMVAPDPRGDVRAGIYLVDPRTLEHTLERSFGRGPAC